MEKLHGADRAVETEPAAVRGALPYQVLPTSLQHLSNATMVSAGVLVKLPVKKRPVSALSCGSDSAPLKFLWPRGVRGRLGTCGRRGRQYGSRRGLGTTGNRLKFPAGCQAHTALPSF
jgi:hypothetical protein